MKKAIYPGSFDPVTFGHLDIIERASKLSDELIVAVLKNSAKRSFFSAEERVAMLGQEVSALGLNNVSVMSFQGLTVDFADSLGCDVIIRGLRAVSDFEYELQIAQTNHVQRSHIETVFLTTSLNYSYLSSTVVREFAAYGGDISKFVPTDIIDRIYERSREAAERSM